MFCIQPQLLILQEVAVQVLCFEHRAQTTELNLMICLHLQH